MEDASGINKDKVDKLIKDIYSYYDRIKEILNEVESIIDDTKNNYKSETADYIRNEFQQYKDKFYIVDTPSSKRNPGYPLDSISIMPELNKYFVDLTSEEKNVANNNSSDLVTRFVIDSIKEIQNK